MPLAANVHLEVFTSEISVQLDPSHCSTAGVPPGGGSPEIHSAEVLLAPFDPCLDLEAFKSATSVQELPFQDSVFAILPPGNSPPQFNADVCVPAPPC